MDLSHPNITRQLIRSSGLSIYDAVADTESPYYYTAMELQSVLREFLIGSDHLRGLPLRTRSIQDCEGYGV